MNKRILASALSAILVLALVAVFMARNTTPVSAQAVLDKAAAAQAVAGPAQGVEHMRNEVYSNIKALPEEQGIDTIIESYRDLQTGNFRTVTSDKKTGKVLEAASYDGSNTYSQDYSQTNTDGNAPLVIYRTPQGQVAGLKPEGGAGGSNAQDLFDQMRKDPHVQFAGQETWADGRSVYALRSEQPIKVLVTGDKVEQPAGTVTMYFDTTSFEMLGDRVAMQKDGKELLISSQTVLVHEVLPAGSKVAWDLSDLQGVRIIDDPDREHGDQLPEVISPQDLAARTKTAYLLESVPAGYSLEISEPQIKPGSGVPYMYIASYSNAADDYFVIQSGDNGQPDQVDETYTTAGGLVLRFTKDDVSSISGKQYVTAFVEAPGGVSFTISSTLPRETVKAWAEQLVLVK